MNAYEQLQLLRDNLGETVEKHWTDQLLLRRLNAAHKEVALRVLNAPGDWLLTKSEAITPNSSGQLALPTNCVYPAYIEEVSGGQPIPVRGTVRERGEGRLPGASIGAGGPEAYLLGNFLEVNQDGYGNSCYVWYQPRIVDLAAGIVAAGDATHVTLELAQWPSGVDDYYNGVTLEVRDVSDNKLNVSGAITDYVGATAVAALAAASIAVTAASGDFYGTVSQLPIELHEWVVLKATAKALAKPSSTFEKELFSFWRAELKSTEEEMESFLNSRFSGSTYTRIVGD